MRQAIARFIAAHIVMDDPHSEDRVIGDVSPTSVDNRALISGRA